MSKRAHQNVKFVLVGDMCVGKTSLANVFVNDTFKELYSASVGGTFMAKNLDALKVTLQIWDTAGMERYRSLLPHFMRDARCAAIVYDISNRDSFLSVQNYWIDYVKTAGPDVSVAVLVANKSDTEMRAVKQHEGRQLADCYNMMFFETSAKYKINVETMFTEVAAALLKLKSTPGSPRQDSIRLELSTVSQRKCCLSS